MLLENQQIHPTAIIHPNARIASGVTVGAYSVVDSDVELAEGCVVGPHVHITGHTKIGIGNQFHSGCVIGDAPQDFKYRDEPTRLEIGSQNVFREHVTIHRSNRMEEVTSIGNENYFMAGSHVGHNGRVGSRNTLANGALLAGHVIVQDQTFISGHCLVHQFCRVGRLAMMQGGSAISKDLPPFCIARGDNHICGVNTVGMRRAGISPTDRLLLRRCYHLLFRSGVRLQIGADELMREFPGNALVEELVLFAKSARRGICGDISKKNAAPDIGIEE